MSQHARVNGFAPWPNVSPGRADMVEALQAAHKRYTTQEEAFEVARYARAEGIELGRKGG